MELLEHSKSGAGNSHEICTSSVFCTVMALFMPAHSSSCAAGTLSCAAHYILPCTILIAKRSKQGAVKANCSDDCYQTADPPMRAAAVSALLGPRIWWPGPEVRGCFKIGCGWALALAVALPGALDLV